VAKLTVSDDAALKLDQLPVIDAVLLKQLVIRFVGSREGRRSRFFDFDILVFNPEFTQSEIIGW
jgi:hypothetical protein